MTDLVPVSDRSPVGASTVTREQRDEIIGKFLREKGARSAHTAARYRRDLACFTEWADSRGFDVFALLPWHVGEYAADLKDGWGGERSPDGVLRASTRAGRINAVSAFYRFLGQQSRDRVLPNPAAHAPRPEVASRSRTRALDAAELEALRAEARKRGPMEYALVQLLAGSGLRISEALGADTHHLRREGGEWYLYVQRKGSEDRVPVQVPVPAARALHRYLRGRRGPLFLDRQGRRLSRQAAANRIRYMALAIGVKDRRVSPHSLRHTATTLALSAGVPIRDVMVQMGHTSTQTTSRYDQENRERNNPTIVALSALIEDGEGDGTEA